MESVRVAPLDERALPLNEVRKGLVYAKLFLGISKLSLSASKALITIGKRLLGASEPLNRFGLLCLYESKVRLHRANLSLNRVDSGSEGLSGLCATDEVNELPKCENGASFDHREASR